ncbi:hypothetical protein Ndes2437B_g08630 [Nannochloris sp. 'desiccata']
MNTHTLVLIQDHRGRYLQSKDTGMLGFGSEGDSFMLCTLVGRSNCFAFRHLFSQNWISLEADKLVLGPHPAALEFFTDLGKCVAFRLPTGAFLTSHRSSGDLTALRGPLRQDKALKLFTIVDVAAPPHSLLSWPIRCHLITQQDGLYISTATGKLAANAEVACCSEELIINLGGRVAPATSHGAAAIGRCSLWNSNATHLASLEPSTSQLIMQPQHACTGREDFKLHLFKYNEIVLTQQDKTTNPAAAPSTCTNTCINTDEEKTVESGVVCRWPSVKCILGERPTKLIIELASSPCFIITAHGQLIGSSSDTGTLTAASFSSCSFSGGAGGPNRQLNAQSWQFEHHGDSTYSIKNTGTNKLLYVTEAGALKLDGNEPLFPDSRILFNIELGWTKVESRERSDLGDSPFESSQKVVKTEQREKSGALASSGQHLAGFTIKTVFRLDGKQLCLTALPDGRIGTCYRKSQPSRWELFALADREAVLQSSAQPLLRLPAFNEEEDAQQQQSSTMRRSNSCQAIMKTPAVAGSFSILSTSPSTLPGILEQAASEDRNKETSDEDIGDGSGDENHDIGGKLTRAIPSMRGRRCASESTLFHLQGNSSTKTKEPTWLADLRKTQTQPSGWDVRSAATMQEQSCHTLCAAALGDFCCTLNPQSPKSLDCMHPEDLIASAESLPDEIKHQVVKKLALLTAPPAAAKLSFQHLSKAAVHGNAPEWSKDLVIEDVDADMLPEEVAESYACTACQGSSGLLLPLDPEINPRHHKFLEAMSRRQFGGIRRRHRAGGGHPDAISNSLQVAKNGILFLGVFRILSVLMK